MFTEQCLARLAFAGLVALSLSIPSVALAEASLPQSSVVSSATTLIKLAGATALVCLVFWAAAHVMKRLQGVSVRSKGRLRILESLTVGQRERVLLISCGDEQMVVGVTSHQINMLHSLAEPLDDSDSTEVEAATPDFGTRFQAALKGRASV